LVACEDPPQEGAELRRVTSAATTVCADGTTVDGIDVSRYQGTINWDAVASSGIAFAIIKSTQSTNHVDPNFAANWSGAGDAGIVRGAYHFFCPEVDGRAQANHMLDTIGTLGPGDLPPALDVEVCPTEVCGSSCDWVGLSCATIQGNIQAWVDRIVEVTGLTPMVYTNVGTWEGSVCSGDFSDLHLWVANWGVGCPSVPSPWSDWVFWQTSATGSVSGISGAVDLDVFNGTLDALWDFAEGTGPVCGDDVCSGGESCASCSDDCGPCDPDPASDAGGQDTGSSDDTGARDAPDDADQPSGCHLGPAGGIVDELDPCWVPMGDDRWDPESPEGYAGHLYWVAETPGPDPVSWARWEPDFAEPGRYRVEVFTDGRLANRAIDAADYEIAHLGGTVHVSVDQSAVDGWQLVGTFDFGAGTGQHIGLGDVPAAPGAGDLVLFDAVRLTRVGDLPGSDAGASDAGSEPLDGGQGDATRVDAAAGDGGIQDTGVATDAPGGSATDLDGEDTDGPSTHVEGRGACGCATSHRSASRVALLLVAVVALLRRRGDRVGST
jgi:GH25 family lysozyme M1 (1,4-beta-N-acetylmuramidase)